MSCDDVLLIYDQTMLAHHPAGWDPERPDWTEAVKALLAEQYPDKDFGDYAHPERPQRLAAIIERLNAEPIDGTRWVEPRPVAARELLRVHTREHVEYVDSLIGRSCWLDIDTTAVSPESVPAARLAAGAGPTGVEALHRGAARRAFCAVRPPGHHALPGRAMGFCLYNNTAVTAAHARELGMSKVLIWDWDLHHGNGTQEIFYADPGVLLVDSHCAAPFYPGTGALEETGSGAGEGFNLNVPLPVGSGNAALLEVAERIVRPAAEAYRPDLFLVSSGFDPHYLDQSFAMDESGFAALMQTVRELADELCDGRLVVNLEGGYNADSLAGSAHAVVSVLAGASNAQVNVLDDDPGVAAAREAVDFHAGRLAELGRRAAHR